MHSVPSEPRRDAAADIHNVLATFQIRTATGTTQLIVGLDLGRVIRVVAGTDHAGLPRRAQEQLAFHAVAHRSMEIEADEVYLLDVQAVERLPDEPGANDPLYLYGMLRGAYPAAIEHGVVAVEGQLATTRGALLHGLAVGAHHAFVYDGASSTRCTHAVIPGGGGERSVVLAFPLVPMGEDGANDLVAAQLVHDVLGALRTDLGDDLALDPVPVPSRRSYERELVAAGWTIEGDHAIHRGGRGRIASLFAPARKQKLPREVALDDFIPLIPPQLARIEGWPLADVAQLRRQLGIDPPPQRPRPPTPASLRTRPPTAPPAIPAPRAQPGPAKPHRRTAQFAVPPPPAGARKRPPTPPPMTVPTRPASRSRIEQAASAFVATSGSHPVGPQAEWIKDLVDAHRGPDRPAPRVTTPGRVGAPDNVLSWMLDLVDTEFPDKE